MNWPDDIKDLIFFPRPSERWEELATLAEPEEWDYTSTSSEYPKPILFNYLRYTYKRLAEEDKIVVADDGSALAFNTGIVTPSQEPIFCYCTQNRLQDRTQPWHFHAWRRAGEHDLTRFSSLPEMAHYFDDPAQLVFDARKELRLNVEHIIADNRARFPEPYRSMPDYQLQTFVRGAIETAQLAALGQSLR